MNRAFSESEYAFLQKEFGLSRSDVAMLTENELYNLGDQCFVIETAEVLAANSMALSERGKTAADIVTRINRR